MSSGHRGRGGGLESSGEGGRFSYANDFHWGGKGVVRGGGKGPRWLRALILGEVITPLLHGEELM